MAFQFLAGFRPAMTDPRKLNPFADNISDRMVIDVIHSQGAEIVRQMETDKIDWVPATLFGEDCMIQIVQPALMVRFGVVKIKHLASGKETNWPLAYRVAPEPRSHVSLPPAFPAVPLDLQQFISKSTINPASFSGVSITIKGRYDTVETLVEQALHGEDVPLCVVCGASWVCEHVLDAELPPGDFVNGDPGELLGGNGPHTRLQIEDMVESGVVSEDDGAYMNGVLRGWRKPSTRAWFNPWTDQPPASAVDPSFDMAEVNRAAHRHSVLPSQVMSMPAGPNCRCAIAAVMDDDHQHPCPNQ